MSALPQAKPIPRPLLKGAEQTARKRLHRRYSRQHAKFTARATETATVLGVNAMLIGACLYTLGNMLPHQLTQQAKLQEIKGEVNRTAEHVQELKHSYDRSLTPEASRRIAEEQGHLIAKNKRNVVWIQPESTQH
ncbi:MAG: hypothetical protein HC790_08650 [Acaryochloridaceae cyanobacterium CSU_3_4]|nr:hypothetical protein [Acaryochloris sp. SU_5_25]NJN38769.1 hypothetical protein [Acaryochloridaceae cyanobacterium CSU_3_4]